MSQFKRFNSSDNANWNSSDAHPQGTLTWDPDNGLRIHDGDTSGGNSVGGASLPTNASGLLTNDGSGNLSWTSAPNLGNITFDGDQIGGTNDIVQIIASNYVKLSGNNSHIWVETDTAKLQAGSYIWTIEDYGFFTAPTGSKFRAAQGVGSTGGYVFNGDGSNTGMFSEGNGVLDFYTDSEKIVSMSSGTIEATREITTPGITFPLSPNEYSASVSQETVDAGQRTDIVLDPDRNVVIKTNQGGHTWRFDEDGDLYLTASGTIRDNNGDSVIPTDVNQLADSSGLLPAAQVRYSMQNANFTAEAGKVYWLDSGTSTKTMTLPTRPTAGDWVKVYDGSMNWPTYNLTVNGNGNTIKIYNIASSAWGTAASTATYNQSLVSPAGPFPIALIWDGSNWYGAI